MKIHYLFGGTNISTPNTAESADSAAKQNALHTAYNTVTKRYKGKRLSTFTRFFELLSTGDEELWTREGFMHCTNQNYLFVKLLLDSGKFKKSDIQPKWALMFCFSPHQYVRVKIANDKYVNVDCWSSSYGIKLGDYAHGFHVSKKD